MQLLDIQPIPQNCKHLEMQSSGEKLYEGNKWGKITQNLIKCQNIFCQKNQISNLLVFMNLEHINM